MPNTVQTFYVDSNAVQSADNISITSVDLYFRAKPNRTTNETGITNPGVTAGICSFDKDTGAIVMIAAVRRAYDDIYDSSTSDAITTFTFDAPALVSTDKTYGIVVFPEDGGYDLWLNRAGDRITMTNDPSGGPTTNKQGQLYTFTGDTVSNEQLNAMLKFSVNIAKFVDNTVTIDLVNRPYEFLVIKDRINVFTGGEFLYANTALQPGTVAVVANTSLITGTGTAFNTLAVGQQIVLMSNTNAQVVAVTGIANSTVVSINPPAMYTNSVSKFRYGIVAKLASADYVNNKITLSDSNANSTQYFTQGLLLTGELSKSSANVASVYNLPVDKFVAHIDASTTLSGTLTTSYAISYSNGSTFNVANTYTPLTSGAQLIADATPHYILSRSNELAQPYLYANNKSAIAKVTLTTSNPYAAPVIRDRQTDLIVYQNQVSNTFTRAYANGTSYDSEVGFNGSATSKYITKKMTFDGARKAEDLVVYVSAFRPANTNIRYYARVYNSDDSDAFDDKYWSPLVYKANENVRSSLDKHDYIEYQLGFPQFPGSTATATGKFTTAANSNVITAVGSIANTIFSAGQTVKVYNELFPTNYMMTTVTASNTTTLTTRTPVTDVGILGTGQKIDIIEFGQTAFNNKGNNNVVRYFNSVGAQFDAFNTVQIKAVLLSDTTSIVPEIDQMEVLGVSA
jgi:hypothetical protein